MVLPSFKVAFSIIPESIPSHPTQLSDDPSTTTPSSHLQQQQQHHHQQYSQSWNPDPSPSPSPSTLTHYPITSPKFSSRPNVPSIPIHLIPGDAPAFGLRRRTLPQPSSLHSQLPSQQNLLPSPFSNGKRPNSPTLHAGAYKRPRGHSVCSGNSSYVKLLSQTSSDKIRSYIPSSIPSNQISSKKLSIQSSLSNQQNNPSSTENQNKQKQNRSIQNQKQSNLKSSINPSLPLLHNPYPPTSTNFSTTYSADGRKSFSHPNTSPPRPVHPSTSNVHRSNIPRTSNLISFAQPTFSHRSAGSKPQSHGFQPSLLNADYIEDSTCRLPVDVLGSPRQKSLNSAATGRTTNILANTSHTMSNPRNPTTSDWSPLYLGRAITASNPENAFTDGTDTLNREKNLETNPNPNRSNDILRPYTTKRKEVTSRAETQSEQPRLSDQQNLHLSCSNISLPHVSPTTSIPSTSGLIGSVKSKLISKQQSPTKSSSLPVSLPVNPVSTKPLLPTSSPPHTPLKLSKPNCTLLPSATTPSTLMHSKPHHQQHQSFIPAQNQLPIPQSTSTPRSISFPVARESQSSVQPNVQYPFSSSGNAPKLPIPTTSSPFLVQDSTGPRTYQGYGASSSISPHKASSSNQQSDSFQIKLNTSRVSRPNIAGSSQPTIPFSGALNTESDSRPPRRELWDQENKVSSAIPTNMRITSLTTGSNSYPREYPSISGSTTNPVRISKSTTGPSPGNGDVYQNPSSSWSPPTEGKTDVEITREPVVSLAQGDQTLQSKLENQAIDLQQNSGNNVRQTPRSTAVPIAARKTPMTPPRTSEEQGTVQCPHCSRKLRNQVTLGNHIRVVHDNSGNYRCSKCSRTFMWKSTLGIHMRLVHEKQRPHACAECDKAFRWKSHLREHQSVEHKGEKPFQCPTCGKAFGRKNNMQKHMRKHNETR